MYRIHCFIYISLEYTEKYKDKLFWEQREDVFNTEKVLVKISEEQPYTCTALLFIHIFVMNVSNFCWPITQEVKQNKINIQIISEFCSISLLKLQESLTSTISASEFCSQFWRKKFQLELCKWHFP